MFNKEESKKYKKTSIEKNSLFKRIGASVATVTLFMSLSLIKAENDKVMKEHFMYENKKIEYMKRVEENKKKKYDEQLVNLYNNGVIQIDNKTYPLKDFFVKYNLVDDTVDLHLMCVGCDYTDILTDSTIEYEYNGVTKFKNTEAFIELINSDCVSIEDNKIIILNKEKALTIINNWNGMIHSLVPDTDAKENKVVFSLGVGYEKTR